MILDGTTKIIEKRCFSISDLCCRMNFEQLMREDASGGDPVVRSKIIPQSSPKVKSGRMSSKYLRSTSSVGFLGKMATSTGQNSRNRSISKTRSSISMHHWADNRACTLSANRTGDTAQSASHNNPQTDPETRARPFSEVDRPSSHRILLPREAPSSPARVRWGTYPSKGSRSSAWRCPVLNCALREP